MAVVNILKVFETTWTFLPEEGKEKLIYVMVYSEYSCHVFGRAACSNVK